MKIDLHCHTKKTKSGDPDTRSVTSELFCEKIMDADIKIAAITNHNHFDLAQYIDFSEKVKSHCQVWPGIELDIINSVEKRWHLVVVANPSKAKEFDDAIKELIASEVPDKCKFEIAQVVESVKSCDVLYIVHFHKEPAVSESDLQELFNLIDDKSRVFHETPDKKSLGVFANHDYKVIVGSDVDDWDKYENHTFAELRLPVSSYEQFCLLSRRDKSVVDTLLNKKKVYEVKASPHKSIEFFLGIFEEVNIIFGQKGTGKSEILKSLYDSLSGQGLDCKMYSGSEKEISFKSLLSTSDLKRDLSMIKAESCEKEFSLMSEWVESAPTLFSNYTNWWKTKDNNANKNRMGITNATTHERLSKKRYEKIKEDFDTSKRIVAVLNEMGIQQYLSDELSAQLLELVETLNDSVRKSLISEFNKIHSDRLTNFSINRIKAIADRNSNTISKPSSTGFLKYASNRVALKSSVEKILNNIDGKESFVRKPIGELEDKGTIYIKSLYRMLCDKSKTDEFVQGIRLLREVKSKIEYIMKNWYKENIADSVVQLRKDFDDNQITSTASFLGLSKSVINEENEEYSPSNGERSILLMQGVLQNESDAYFLDEPELGMGNSYIDTTIRPRISELGKQGKVVVVATHNANIAVRTLPYNSIFRVHENGNYSTYVGNPFTDELVNIYDPRDKKDWKSESMHTLEGGEEAFYERKSIYESGNCKS